jgi:hypothetical protein
MHSADMEGGALEAAEKLIGAAAERHSSLCGPSLL